MGGVNALADAIQTSPILFSGNVPQEQNVGGGQDLIGGVDPNMDPELAMAIRISLEEERARQKKKDDDQKKDKDEKEDKPEKIEEEA